MKKAYKIVLAIIVVMMLFIAAISVIIKSYINEDRIRDMVLEVSEKHLGRKAVLGSVDISLLRGIIIRDFEIREKDSETLFFKTREN